MVDERIQNEKFTAIGLWVGQEDLYKFRDTVRGYIRAELDATLDSWPLRAVQDYRPEVRRAILKAMENHWEMVNIENHNDDTELSANDDFVRGELIHDAFCNEQRTQEL
ncbi:hypothetical protein BJ166DRAFT_496942 [Pestalotiopsis sp. NC0098]|nr:hypothetical protein BJ166DRAFT_496942 [Pestalotiopsis sp. NC0098]